MTAVPLIAVHVLLRRRTPLPHEELEKGKIRLSIPEYTQEYGAAPADIDRMVAYARRNGLIVTDTNPTWRTVSLKGSPSCLGRAFGVRPFLDYENGRWCWNFSGPICMPKRVADLVVWVFDLYGWHPLRMGPTQRRSPHLPGWLAARSQARPAGKKNGDDSPPVPSYSPPRFAEFYDFPENDGEGECVGVLEISGGYKRSDMEIFFDDLGLDMPRIVDVGRNVWARGRGTYWNNFEVTMDVQVVASCVPKAKTVVYFGGAERVQEITAWTYFKVISMGLFDEVHRPSVLTFSAGLPENLPGNWIKGEAEIINDLLSSASALGVTVCVAAGDSGGIFPCGTGMFDAPSMAYFPGSSPWVLCCGGTTLHIDPDGETVQGEAVWNRLSQHMWNLYPRSGESSVTVPNPPPWGGVPGNLGAGTGGVSWYFKPPSYQSQAQVPLFEVRDFVDWAFESVDRIPGRGVPDIAANADFLSGYRVFIDGKWRNGGGTSAATPLMASLMTRYNAILGERIGFVNPLLYDLKLEKNAQVFNKIEGNNGAFVARRDDGWNPCVGLGSPRGRELLEALRAVLPRS